MITLQNVYKSFDNKKLFNDFSMSVPDGSFVVITGASGSGKTTLLNLISGIEKPNSGKILIDDKDVSNKKDLLYLYRYRFGFLFQNFALIDNKNVKKNLEIYNKDCLNGIAIDYALTKVGLSDKAETPVYKLSGGEQQRVALARIMIKKCDIILADEPTGSLDSKNAEIIMNYLDELNNEKKTIIMVTHDERLIKPTYKHIIL